MITVEPESGRSPVSGQMRSRPMHVTESIILTVLKEQLISSTLILLPTTPSLSIREPYACSKATFTASVSTI